MKTKETKRREADERQKRYDGLSLEKKLAIAGAKVKAKLLKTKGAK